MVLLVCLISLIITPSQSWPGVKQTVYEVPAANGVAEGEGPAKANEAVKESKESAVMKVRITATP